MNRMTIAQARAHFGFNDTVTERVVRAAAAAADIQIIEASEPAAAGGASGEPAGQGQRVGGAPAAGGAGDGDGEGGIAARLRDLTAIGERVATALSGANGQGEQQLTALGTRVDEVLRDAQAAGLHTPSMRPAEPRIRVYDRFDQMGYTRADFELAGMIFGGTQSGQVRTNPIAMPDDFKRAWQHHVFSDPSRVPWHSDGEGHPTRAMDTAESGFGADLIGQQYVTELWQAARNNDGIVGAIRNIPMMDSTVTVPIDGDLPEMLFVGESTGDSATAYGVSGTGSGSRDLSAKKFTIQQIWSGELNEDSIIAFTPFLREKLAQSTTLHLGSAMYNGDTTNAATGNINLDDADPADTKHYLAFDGIRHFFLVDSTGQGKDMAGALDLKEVARARGKLNGGDDDVDNLLKNINWGTNPRDLRVVADWDTYIALTDFDEVRTIDRYGSSATIVTGELGQVDGMPIISPGYASKTEADGKASTTEASNTKGQLTVFAPAGWLRGTRRDVQLYFDRIQRTDQFLFELYTRVGFNRFGNNVAAGVYDITV